MKVIRVTYNVLYDLFFRCKQSNLLPGEYRVPFEEYVKAMVAFNPRVTNRKISFFARVYKALDKIDFWTEEDVEVVGQALRYLYTDLVYLYEQATLSQKERNIEHSLLTGDAVLLPANEYDARMRESFKTKSVRLDSYMPKKTDLEKIAIRTPTSEEISESISSKVMHMLNDEVAEKEVRLLEVSNE